MGNKDRTQITQFFVLYKATDIDLKKCWIKIPKEDLLKTHPLWENKEIEVSRNEDTPPAIKSFYPVRFRKFPYRTVPDVGFKYFFIRSYYAGIFRSFQFL